VRVVTAAKQKKTGWESSRQHSNENNRVRVVTAAQQRKQKGESHHGSTATMFCFLWFEY
jgi:hypothetical protein